MYATKLMMNQNKIYNYVEDDSLVYFNENATELALGTILATVPNVTNGVNSFTFCGTPPTLTNPTDTSRIYIFINNYVGLYRNKTAQVVSLGYVPTGAAIVRVETVNDTIPFVVATITTVGDGVLKYTITNMDTGVAATTESSKYHGSQINCILSPFTNILNTDLVMVYNRLLTDEEIEQNFKAFVQRHRQEH